MSALSSIGGLFPDTNDDAHILLFSLIGVIIGAKAGRSDHILLSSGSLIPGTKKGFGHAYLGGFALSAVKALTDRELLSDRKARAKVAKLLADQGCNLTTGDHGEIIPITDSAIKNWKKKEAYPLHNAIALEMEPIHRINLEQRSAVTLDKVMTYFEEAAVDAVRLYGLY
jgi:hypothetical protein